MEQREIYRLQRENDRYRRDLTQQADQYEDRITELHSVLAELKRKLDKSQHHRTKGTVADIVEVSDDDEIEDDIEEEDEVECTGWDERETDGVGLMTVRSEPKDLQSPIIANDTVFQRTSSEPQNENSNRKQEVSLRYLILTLN